MGSIAETTVDSDVTAASVPVEVTDWVEVATIPAGKNDVSAACGRIFSAVIGNHANIIMSSSTDLRSFVAILFSILSTSILLNVFNPFRNFNPKTATVPSFLWFLFLRAEPFNVSHKQKNGISMRSSLSAHFPAFTCECGCL